MKIHEYNEMMAYLTRPARTGFKHGGTWKDYMLRGEEYKDLSFEEWLREDKAYGGRIGLYKGESVVKALGQQLIDLVEEKPLESLVPGTDAYALVSSLHTQMKSFYQRDIVQAGANLTNTEVKIVNDIVSKPNPFNIVTGTYINKLNTLIRELKVKEDQYLRQRDIIPVGKQATFRKYDPKKKGKTIVTGDN